MSFCQIHSLRLQSVHELPLILVILLQLVQLSFCCSQFSLCASQLSCGSCQSRLPHGMNQHKSRQQLSGIRCVPGRQHSSR